MNDLLQDLRRHRDALRTCRRYPDMTGPVVVGEPVGSPVLLLGQAPGDKEIELGRPFAWTAGKTLLDRALRLISLHAAWRDIRTITKG